jgi:hypothetical protein
MSLAEVACQFARGTVGLKVRELTGFDEQAVQDVSTATAIGLLDRLVVGKPQSSWRAAQLTPSDRDRCLAAVYRMTYGQRIDSAPRCTQCGNLFDLTFSLDDLLATVDRAPAPGVSEALPDGTFRTTAGVRFRPPTGEDELEVAGLPPQQASEALLERCLLEAPAGVDARAAIEDALEASAPVLDLDVGTACPECGAGQAVHFDVQFYLLRAIELERPRVAREIHRLASAYGWGLQEILSLRRSQRRLFVELVETEQLPRRRPP